LFRLASTRDNALTAADRDWFVTVAGGNPYFLTELARHHSATGQLYSIPPSLESLLSERVRRLSPHALRLLQVISLLGRHSDLHRLQGILELETFSLLAAIEELESHELVHTDEKQVVPKHALVGDNAVKLCTPAATKLIHRRIAQVLEAEVLETQAVSVLWTCADHWQLAGDNERAAQLMKTCATHMLTIGYASGAVEILERSAREPQSAEERIRLYNQLGLAYKVVRDWSNATRVYQELIDFKRSLSIRISAHSDEEIQIIEATWFNEENVAGSIVSSELLQQLTMCAESSEATPNHRLEAARFGLGIADDAGEPLLVMDRLYNAVVPLLIKPIGSEQTQQYIRLIYGTIRGDLDDGIAAAFELVSSVRRSGIVSDLIKALRNCALPLRYAGMFSEAESFLREAIELARERKLWRTYVNMLDSLASIQLDQELTTNARATLSIAIEKAPEYRGTLAETSIKSMRFRVAIAESNVEEAELYGEFETDFSSHQIERFRNELAANTIILAVLKREHPPDRLVKTLAGSYAKNHWNAGRRDLHTVALVAGLRAGGQESAAKSLMKTYLNEYRRERYPLPSYLKHLTEL